MKNILKSLFSVLFLFVGVPLAASFIDVDMHLQVLGFKAGDNPTEGELRKPVLRLRQKWHPDKFAKDPIGALEAEVRMKEIGEAETNLKRIFYNPKDYDGQRIKGQTMPLDVVTIDKYRQWALRQYQYTAWKNQRAIDRLEEKRQADERLKKVQALAQAVNDLLQNLDAKRNQVDSSADEVEQDRLLIETIQIVDQLKQLFQKHKDEYRVEVIRWQQSSQFVDFQTWKDRIYRHRMQKQKPQRKKELTEKIEALLQKLQEKKIAAENAVDDLIQDGYINDIQNILTGMSGSDKSFQQLFDEHKDMFAVEIAAWKNDPRYIADFDKWKREILHKRRAKEFMNLVEGILQQVKIKRDLAEQETDEVKQDQYIYDVYRLFDRYSEPKGLYRIFEKNNVLFAAEVAAWKNDPRYIPDVDAWKKNLLKPREKKVFVAKVEALFKESDEYIQKAEEAADTWWQNHYIQEASYILKKQSYNRSKLENLFSNYETDYPDEIKVFRERVASYDFDGWKAGVLKQRELLALKQKVEKLFKTLRDNKTCAEDTDFTFQRDIFVQFAHGAVYGTMDRWGYGEDGLQTLFARNRAQFPTEVAQWSEDEDYKTFDAWKKNIATVAKLKSFKARVDERFIHLRKEKLLAEAAQSVLDRQWHVYRASAATQNLKELFDQHRADFPDEVEKYESESDYKDFKEWEKNLEIVATKRVFQEKAEKLFKELEEYKKYAEDRHEKTEYISKVFAIAHGASYPRYSSEPTNLKDLFDRYRAEIPDEVAEWEKRNEYALLDEWKKNLEAIRIKSNVIKKVETLFTALEDAQQCVQCATDEYIRDWWLNRLDEIAYGKGSATSEGLKELFDQYRDVLPDEVAQWEQDVRYKNLKQWKQKLLKPDLVDGEDHHNDGSAQLHQGGSGKGDEQKKQLRSDSNKGLTKTGVLKIVGLCATSICIYKAIAVYKRYKELKAELYKRFPGRRVSHMKILVRACEDEGILFFSSSQMIDARKEQLSETEDSVYDQRMESSVSQVA